MTIIAILFTIFVWMLFYQEPSFGTLMLALIGVLALWLRYDEGRL
jgi:hypothetical protein